MVYTISLSVLSTVERAVIMAIIATTGTMRPTLTHIEISKMDNGKKLATRFLSV
jgi:hypothetical protein